MFGRESLKVKYGTFKGEWRLKLLERGFRRISMNSEKRLDILDAGLDLGRYLYGLLRGGIIWSVVIYPIRC